MLKGKVAVVTGGSRGIGKSVCTLLAQNGADVALLYAGNEAKAQETVQELLECGVKAAAYKCNVADFEETKETFGKIVEDFGTVDILVNNAGQTRDMLMVRMADSDFGDIIDINLKGVFNTIKQVYRIFTKKKSGKIINVSSVSGLMGNAGQVNYSASKAGVIGLTKSVAKELASRGITCNAIAPGFVSTDMTAAFTDNQQLLDTIPMKRFAQPEEIAQLVLFLASDNANYITGEVIRIDGGLAM